MLQVAVARSEERLLARRATVLAPGAVALATGFTLVSASIGASDAALPAVVAGSGLVLVVAQAGLGRALAGTSGALAWGMLAAILALTLGPRLGATEDLRLLAAATGLATLPLVAGHLPGALSRSFATGRREHLTPVLLLCASAGGLGVLAAISLAGPVDTGGGRLEDLVPYAAAGAALLALAQVLAHHRIAAGSPGTAEAVAGAAIVVEVLVLLDPGGAPVDDAVTAMVAAAAAAAVGLLVATAAASPRPLTVPAEDVGDGPRVIGPALAALVAAALAARLLAWRDVWLDEAALARAAGAGSVPDLLDTARGLDAHPPLLDGLLWVARNLIGAGDLALRLPALVAGLLLVPAVYVAATRLYDRRVGLVAAVVTAVGPALVWLSTSARPGVLAALLATLALFAALRAVDEGRWADWVLLGVAGAALVWTHQLGVVHVLVLHAGLAALVWHRQRHGLPVRGMVAGWAAATGMAAAALVALVAYRGGVGPARLLPPLEYATAGAPGAGRSVFGLAGVGAAGLVGFHPEDVTSRMLALWPLGILVVFVLAVRSWSPRSLLLAALAAAPFVALLLAQILGEPREPPFALEWIATAVPMLAIGLARIVTLWGHWSTVRLAAAALAAVMGLALVDQTVRVQPVARFAIQPAVDEVAAEAERGDVVLYSPDLMADLIRHEAPAVEPVPVEDADQTDLTGAGQVFVVGAFGYMGADSEHGDVTLALVEDLAARRPLAEETEHGSTKVWRFR